MKIVHVPWARGNVSNYVFSTRRNSPFSLSLSLGAYSILLIKLFTFKGIAQV